MLAFSMATLKDFPTVSIIITTLNNEQTIDECLKSIFDLDYPRDLMEVIVVDGGSKDSTVEIAKKYPAKVIVKPSNAPSAYNYALKIARGDLIAIVDADVKVERGWLSRLAGRMKDPLVACVGGGIETWNPQRVLPRCIGYDIKYRYGRLLKSGDIKRLATMNLLIRRNVLEKVGGFDESLPTQYDTELGYRITDRGYKIIFEPEAKCYHFNRQTWREYFKQQFQYGKNTIRLYLKKPSLIKGDRITDFGMNIQPVLLIIAFILAVLGLTLEQARFTLYVSTAILAFLLAYYVIYAAKVSLQFKDPTALLLVPICFVRAVAWTLGGIFGIFKTVKAGEESSVD